MKEHSGRITLRNLLFASVILTQLFLVVNSYYIECSSSKAIRNTDSEDGKDPWYFCTKMLFGPEAGIWWESWVTSDTKANDMEQEEG